jgi:hypothetical protein
VLLERFALLSNRADQLTKSGLRKKKSKSKDRVSFNVVHFRKVGESGGANEEKLKGVTKLRAGEYQSIADR